MNTAMRGVAVLIAVGVLGQLAIAGPSSDTQATWAVVGWNGLMAGLFAIALRSAASTSCHHRLLGDGRVYVIVALFVYSVWVPLLILVEGVGDFVLLPFTGHTWAPKDLHHSQVASCLMFGGLVLGMKVTALVGGVQPAGAAVSSPVRSRTGQIGRMEAYESAGCRDISLAGWAGVSAISHGIFLLPFFAGGFQALDSGGSVLSFDRQLAFFGGYADIAASVLFSPEVLTISTAMTLYAASSQGRSVFVRYATVITVVSLSLVVAATTTRTARTVAVLVCLVCIVNMRQVAAPGLRKLASWAAFVGVGVIYWLGAEDAGASVAGEWSRKAVGQQMRAFDGLGPYDALLLATGQDPVSQMLLNVPFSLVRPIPLVGEALAGNLLGLGDSSPLYLWMAAGYSDVYASGGGLAYMPQIEGLLTGGAFGVLVTGVVLGLLLGKSRDGMLNIILAASSLAVARGSLGIMAALVFPYVIMSWFIYGAVFGRGALRRGMVPAQRNAGWQMRARQRPRIDSQTPRQCFSPSPLVGLRGRQDRRGMNSVNGRTKVGGEWLERDAGLMRERKRHAST